MAQIMKLSYFPQIKVVHTSKTFHGQLYVPMLNWCLMIGTILVASIFNNVSHCPFIPMISTDRNTDYITWKCLWVWPAPYIS